MAPDPHATNLDAEIAEIENRRGTRNLFLVLGGILGLILVLVVIFGARERTRLAAEAARPKFEEVVLGRYVGQASNQAVFAEGQRLNYVEGIGESEIGSSPTFVRALEYDAAGNPATVPEGTFFWSLESADSLPYVIEPVINPLTGVSPSDYQELDLGTVARLRRLRSAKHPHFFQSVVETYAATARRDLDASLRCQLRSRAFGRRHHQRVDHGDRHGAKRAGSARLRGARRRTGPPEESPRWPAPGSAG